jgi:hypothetical protein
MLAVVDPSLGDLTFGALIGLGAIALLIRWERRPPTVRRRERCCPDCDQPLTRHGHGRRPGLPEPPLYGTIYRPGPPGWPALPNQEEHHDLDRPR